MSKKTHAQAVAAVNQPYTVTVPVMGEEGPVLQVFGYTPERRLQEDETWRLEWEQHDLGQMATHSIAKQVAADWREGLVGIYPLD